LQTLLHFSISALAQEVGEPDGAWPEDLQSIGIEAWSRYEAGEISEDELYPADAQWAGIFDQRKNPTEEETRRRRLLSGPLLATSEIALQAERNLR
jgi:hypothetical protein